MSTIKPHGGTLTTRLVSDDRIQALESEAQSLVTIQVPKREQCDIEMIGNGAFSPLDGFMGEADFHGVCDKMQMANGTSWPIPITCSTDSATADKIDIGSRVALTDHNGRLLAVLTVNEKYAHDKAKEAKQAAESIAQRLRALGATIELTAAAS